MLLRLVRPRWSLRFALLRVLVQISLTNHSRRQRIVLLSRALFAPVAAALSLFTGAGTQSSFGQQAFGLHSREAFVPKDHRERDMCFEAFSKGYNALGLRVDLAIQADGKANDQTLSLGFLDQLLYS